MCISNPLWFSSNLIFVDNNKFVDSFLLQTMQNERNKVYFLILYAVNDSIKIVILEVFTALTLLAY